MGVTESVSAVMWARRRQPGEIAYGIALGHERFSPCELLDQAVEAGRAGFDLVASSDHLAPWWDPAGGPPAHCAKDGGGADHHRQAAAMGATAVVMMNVSGAEPLGTIRLYGNRVLPALRG